MSLDAQQMRCSWILWIKRTSEDPMLMVSKLQAWMHPLHPALSASLQSWKHSWRNILDPVKMLHLSITHEKPAR